MPYIGNQPGTGVRSRFIYTATASQTTFSGADDNSKTLSYADSNYIDVYLNGVCLEPGTDYTASTKTSVVLTQAASLGDTLKVIAYDIATVSDTVSQVNGGTFEGNVTFGTGADIITATAGTDNVRIGEGAGDSIASGGNNNVAIGKDAGTSISTGDHNTAVGYNALDAMTTSSYNTAIGSNAATAVTTGQRNTALGYGALQTDTQGDRATAIGFNALGTQNSSTSNYNVGVGYDAGGAITTATHNTLIGSLVGDALTSGSANVAIGGGADYAALGSDTQGKFTTAIGFGALRAQNFTSDTASNNVAVGYFAGGVMTTGTGNTFLGSLAGDDCVDGVGNTAVGHGALSADAGNSNTAVGQSAAHGSTGAENTCIGGEAGYSLTDGGKNTFLGYGAGYHVQGGNDNTVVGKFNGNQDNLDIRNTNDQIAISTGDGNVRIFCNSEGYTKHKPVNSGHYSTGGAYHEFDHNNNDTSAIIYYQQHASYVSSVQFTQAQRVASSSYSMAEWRSGAGSDVEFYLRGDGNAYADGTWNGGGADYAEYFEWTDGNSSNQDRTGYTVVLDNEKIRLATSDDAAANIIGAVSVNPSVVGDSDIDQWKHKYRRDDLNGFVWETYTVTEWTETVVDQEAADEVLDDDGKVVTPALPLITREVFHNYETDKIPDGVTAPDDASVLTEDANGNTLKRKVLNTDYNPDAAYVSREDRQEWATIGMMGKLRIRKGQPTGDRWIKMRDISDTVEEWLVR